MFAKGEAKRSVNDAHQGKKLTTEFTNERERLSEVLKDHFVEGWSSFILGEL